VALPLDGGRGRRRRGGQHVEAEPEGREHLDIAVVQVAGDPPTLFHHACTRRLLEDVERLDLGNHMAQQEVGKPFRRPSPAPRRSEEE
jgi:hypothetical protein